MISKAKLKELAAYKQQKTCDLQGVFVAEGVKLADEILSARLPILTLCATPRWLSLNAEKLDSDTQIFEISADELSRLSSLRTPNEVWMLLSRQSLAPQPHDGRLVLALDRLQDPGNLGTIIRTADWFGIRRIVCSPDTVSCFNPKVVQSTMGSLFRTEILYTDLPQWLAQCGLPIYGALLDGTDVRNVELQSDAVLVIGNESRGISPEVQQHVTHRVLIPNMGSTCESLNAAVAAAILVSRWKL